MPLRPGTLPGPRAQQLGALRLGALRLGALRPCALPNMHSQSKNPQSKFGDKYLDNIKVPLWE